MATIGNNNSNKPANPSNQPQSNQQHLDQGNSHPQTVATNAAAPAVALQTASIQAHGVMYAQNGIVAGQIFNVAQNGDASTGNGGAAGGGNINPATLSNALNGALNGNQTYSVSNPAPISSDNILTFFGTTPGGNTHGNVINPEVNLPNTLVAANTPFTDNVEEAVGTSHPLGFDYGTPGPINAGFATTYTPESFVTNEQTFIAFNTPSLFLITNPAAVVVTPATPITDLGVTIAPHTGTVIPGTIENYTITITNHGPTTVTNFSMADLVPNQFIGPVTFGNTSAGTIVYGIGGVASNSVWTGSLAVGASITTTVQGLIDPNATGNLLDTVNITDNTPNVSDTVTIDKSDSSILTLIPTVDLNIVKSDNDGGSSGGLIGTVTTPSSIGTVVPGQNYTYSVSLTNGGPSEIHSLTLGDVLPPGFTASSFTPSTGTYDATTGLWTGLNFASGNVIQLQISGSLSTSVLTNLPANGEVINVAEVTVPSGVTNTNPVIVAVDVDNLNNVVKSDSGGGSSATGTTGTFIAGAQESYTITVTNYSINAVTGTISDPLNNSFVNDSWSAVGTNGASAATATGTGVIPTDTLTLPANSSITFTITGTELLTATGTVANQVTYTPGNSQPVIVTDYVNIVSMIKSDSGGGTSPTAAHPTGIIGTFVADAHESYTITLTNTSGNVVTGSFIDPLNAYFLNASWTAVGTNGSTIAVASGVGAITSADALTLNPNSTITFTFDGTIADNAPAVISNTADFTPTGGITVPVTDTDNVNHVVKSDSAGGSSATGTTGTFVAGAQETYTVTVTNSSPNAQTGTISDPLNATFLNDSWTAVGTNGASAAIASGTGVIPTDALILPGNSTITFTITGTEALSASGTVNNQVTYTSTGATPVIVTDFDNIVNLVKSDTGGGTSPTVAHPNGVIGTFVVGAQESYTVTLTNTSANTVTGSFIDPLNAYFINDTWTAVGTNGSHAVIASGVGAITAADLITLDPNSSLTFTFTGTIANNAPAVISNTADFTPTGGTAIPVTDTDNVDHVVKSDSGGGSSATGTTGTFVAGAQETYTITVTNSSPNAQTGTISDPLNVTFLNDSWTAVGTNGASAAIASGTGVIPTDALILPGNSTITFTVTGTEALTASGTVNNQVTYTSTGATPVIVTDFDNIVNLVKSDSGGGTSPTVAHPNGVIGTFVVGAQESYTVTLTNTSANTVTGSFIDPLNAYFINDTWTAVGTNGSHAVVASGVGAITAADLITLDPNSSLTFTFNGTIANNAPAVISNTADFTPTGGTMVAVTDTDNVDHVVKSDSAGGSSATGAMGTFVAGAQETYTITVTNSSPNAQTGTISDPLPSAFTNDSWTAVGTNGASAAITSGTGSIPTDALTLPANSTVTFTITGTEALTATGTQNNQITYTPNGATPIIVVDNDNIITVVKSDTGGGTSPTAANPSGVIGTFVAGAQETYHITLTNTSVNTVSGSISDSAYLSFFDGSKAINWSVALPAGDTASATSGTGSITGDNITLIGGSSITFNVTGTVEQNAPSTVSNTVNFTPLGGTTIPITDTDHVVNQGALSITKVDNDGGSSITGTIGNAIPGTSITYSVVAANNGPSNLVGGDVHDTLPSDLTSWTVTGPNGFTASGVNGGSFDDGAVNINAGSNVTFTVTGTISASATGTMSNVVTITPPGSFTNTTPGSATATDTDNLNANANLNITKTDNDGGNVKPNESITYTIVVTNTGPSVATGVSVFDTLPTQGLNNISSPNLPTGVTFNSANDTWTIGALAVGASETLTLMGTTPANISGTTYVNEATATATDATTVHAFDTDTITPQSDVAIIKTASDITPHLGEQETYTLQIQNNGPSSAANVTVTDALPAGLGYINGSASNGGTFNASTDTLSWNLSSLNSGATAALTFLASVNSFAYELGSVTAASLAAVQAAWGFNGSTPPSTLHAYTLGTSDLTGTDGLHLDTSFANATGTVTSSWTSNNADTGVGVAGGASTTSEIEYNGSQAETLVVNLGHTNIDYATVTFSSLGGGEQGQITAYDANGVEVGGPIWFQGTTNGGDNTTVTVSPGADFAYLAVTAIPSVSNGTSSLYIEDIQAEPDTINNTASVTSTTFDTNSGNNTSTVSIHPEVPVAQVAAETIAQGAAETNILIVLDRTGSMADDVTVNGMSIPKLEAAVNAIDYLLGVYGDNGNVAVKLVDFNTTGTILTSSWVSIATAESLLSGITASGSTNYDAALGLHPNGLGTNYTTGAEEAFTTTGSSGAGYLAGGNNVLYFLTDGGANTPSNSAGINPNEPGNAGEEAQWQGFLTTNNITAYAVALGISGSTLASVSGGTNNDTVSQELTPIASNANDALFVTNYSQLATDLGNTVVAHTGNLLTETGSSFGTATPGYIQSVALMGDGYTYDFNPSSNSITTLGAGSSTETFNASTELLTITSATLGTLNVYMENSGVNAAGNYTYTAPSTITSTAELDVPIQFNLSDSANNTATGVLTIVDTHDSLTVTNTASVNEGVIVTIVQEGNPSNSYSQLIEVGSGANINVALNLANEFSFINGDKYAISIEGAANNTAALGISGFIIDGINIQTGGTVNIGGNGNPYAATYEFQAPSAVTQGETDSSTSASDSSLIHYLYNSASGATLNATNATANSLADFLNAGNNSTLNNTQSSASVMEYNPTNTYNGNGHDVLEINQGAIASTQNASNAIDLTGNSTIHNIGAILLTDGPNGGGTNLTLGPQDVFDLTENSAHTATGNSNTLFINGSSNSTVNIGTGWTSAGTSGNYNEYTQAVTVNHTSVIDHLYIQQQMHIVSH